MELVFKLPKNKLPFIGLLFEKEYLAQITNEHFVNDHSSEKFSLKLDLMGSVNAHTTVRICSNTSNLFHMYNEPINCDVAKLKAWHSWVKGPVNFGHIIRKGDKDILVYTRAKRKPFFLPVENVWIEFEY